MSEFTTDNVSGKVEFTTANVSDEIEDKPQVEFTIDDVPDETQNIRLVGLLYVEILGAGRMMATGNELQVRANALKIKNHVVYWAYIHPTDATAKRSTIRSSMNIVNPGASFGSNEAQYAHSSDRSRLLGFGSSFSVSGDLTSHGDAPPDNDAVPSGDGSSALGGSGSSGDVASVSNDSQLVAMLPRGVPAQGQLDIKVRDYPGKSNSAVTYFTLRIIGEPIFGNFLDSLRDRNMFPFPFPKLGFSYLGCRHFVYAILFTHE